VDGCTGTSWHAGIPTVVGISTIVILVVTPFILARRLRRAPGWTDLARPSIVVGVLLAIGLLAYILTESVGWSCLVQRGMAVVAPVWAGALAVRLSVVALGRLAPAARHGAQR
jgi:hypothetical protein